MIALGSAVAACSYYLGYLGVIKSQTSLRENQEIQTTRLSKECELLLRTIEKINSERSDIEKQLDDFFNQLATWNAPKPHTHRMFQPECGQIMLALNQELDAHHKILIETLRGYPSYAPEFAHDPQALRDFGQALEEHHTLACQNASSFFRAFDDYLQNLDKATIEVQSMQNH